MSEHTRVRSGAEEVLLASRYVLMPMYFGLIVYMISYNIAFFGTLWECMKDLRHAGYNFKELSELLKLAAIDGIDSVMIANLIVMITVGSQSIFVNEIPSGTHNPLPRFMKNLGSGMLKIKMASSLVGVTAVHLLTSFVNIKSIGWNNLIKELTIHFAFIISAYVFAKMEIMLHPPHAEAESH